MLADPGNLTLGVGEVSAPISAVTDTGVTTGFVFTSSKPKAASVTADGVVTGVKKGSATITVQSGRVSALVKVTVKAAPKSIALNTGSLTLGYDAATGAGEQATLKATLSKDSASALSFRGYDANVVAVDPDGTVRAVGCGTTKITVATFNNRTAVAFPYLCALPITGRGGDRTPADRPGGHDRCSTDRLRRHHFRRSENQAATDRPSATCRCAH